MFCYNNILFCVSWDYSSKGDWLVICWLCANSALGRFHGYASSEFSVAWCCLRGTDAFTELPPRRKSEPDFLGPVLMLQSHFPCSRPVDYVSWLCGDFMFSCYAFPLVLHCTHPLTGLWTIRPCSPLVGNFYSDDVTVGCPDLFRLRSAAAAYTAFPGSWDGVSFPSYGAFIFPSHKRLFFSRTTMQLGVIILHLNNELSDAGDPV